MSTPEESHFDENKDKEQGKKTSLKEQAINKEKTQGKKINHQVEQKKQQHEPRDNA